jgi:hypothetical protein
MIRELNNKKPLASNVGAVTSTPGTLPIDKGDDKGTLPIDDKNDDANDDANDQFRKFLKVILASPQRRLGSRKQAEALVSTLLPLGTTWRRARRTKSFTP